MAKVRRQGCGKDGISQKPALVGNDGTDVGAKTSESVAKSRGQEIGASHRVMSVQLAGAAPIVTDMTAGTPEITDKFQ